MFFPALFSNLGHVTVCENGEPSSDEGLRERLVRASTLPFSDRHLTDVQRLCVADVAVVVADLKVAILIFLPVFDIIHLTVMHIGYLTSVHSTLIELISHVTLSYFYK